MSKRRYVVQGIKIAAGSALLVASVAAAPAAVAARAPQASRAEAVHQELQDAVRWGQVSNEQAARFEERLAQYRRDHA